MDVPDRLYHASAVRGLRELVPGQSTHGTWVYAVGDPILAACFLSTTGGDLTCAVGRDRRTGRPYLCERFEGAFERRYAGAAGSIYVLDGDGFLAGRTPWDEEYVSGRVVRPLSEIRVEDACEYLEDLSRSGELALVRYPGRIDGIPADDSDLVERAVLGVDRFGPDVLRGFAEYHPALMPRIRSALGPRRIDRTRSADNVV